MEDRMKVGAAMMVCGNAASLNAQPDGIRRSNNKESN
jgi:hypothetical protein